MRTSHIIGIVLSLIPLPIVLYYLNSDKLIDWQLAVTLVFVEVPIGLFFHFLTKEKKHSQDNEEFYKKIYEELKDGIESLDNTLVRDTYKVEIQGKEIYWKHIFMNHAVYDSLINSGDFNLIDHKLQQSIQDIYGKINLHAEGVKKIVADRDNAAEQAPILDVYEEELRKEITSVMEKLKKYF